MTLAKDRTILVVEDDPQVRAVVMRFLRSTCSRVFEADCCCRAQEILTTSSIDIVLVDLHLEDGSGFDIVDRLARTPGGPSVIVMTADLQIDNAILALQRGVVDFLLKPFALEALESAIERALISRPERSCEPPTPQTLEALDVWRRTYAPGLLGEHPLLMRVFHTLQRVCDTDCSVLITGESGTGKELVARALHAASGRADGPFVTVNCAAIPENLLESELFGHTRGAFTGAVAPRVGRFAAADGGTLFLDEVGELPLSQQAKLLRAVQEREIIPVGESRGRKVDVRLLAATHRDLEAMVEEGTFREDLFYRIQVVPVELPTLRERRDDVARLIERFIEQTNTRRKRSVTSVSEQAMAALVSYDWPGNVRQLENVVERMVLLRSQGEISVEDLPLRIAERSLPTLAKAATVLPDDGIDLRDAVEQFENGLILQALERTGWNKNRAAAVLRMNRTTLVEKLKKKNLLEDSTAA